MDFDNVGHGYVIDCHAAVALKVRVLSMLRDLLRVVMYVIGLVVSNWVPELHAWCLTIPNRGLRVVSHSPWTVVSIALLNLELIFPGLFFF